MPDLTLFDGSTTISLPYDLEWSDELNWSPIEQVIDKGLDGALIVQEGKSNYGRPITLESNGSAPMTRLEAQQLKAWEEELGKVALLTFPDAQTFNVMFDRSSGPALIFSQLRRLANSVQSTDHLYFATLKFITVE